MKNLLIAATLLCLLSCKEKSETAPNVIENVPNFISNISSKSSSSYGKGISLINAVYSEIIKNDEKLQTLDQEINALEKNSNEIIFMNQALLEKPSEYFDEAHRKIASIKDSSLRKQMQDFIKENSENFDTKRKDLEATAKHIQANNKNIQDSYNAFKIRKTLPQIELYQEENPVRVKELQKLITQQNELVEQFKILK